MSVLLSFLKIMWYCVLIVYHAADVYFDWQAYHDLVSDSGDFSAIPDNNKVAGTFFLISCICGTLLSVLMVAVYCYYIRYHRSFMVSSRLYRIKKTCDNRVVVIEFTISLLELTMKDGIQSSLSFVAFDSSPERDCVSSSTRAFLACSIIAGVKLFACFATKLLGLGAGEEIDSIVKSLLCGFGCICSILFLFFTSLYCSSIRGVPICKNLH